MEDEINAHDGIIRRPQNRPMFNRLPVRNRPQPYRPAPLDGDPRNYQVNPVRRGPPLFYRPTPRELFGLD